MITPHVRASFGSREVESLDDAIDAHPPAERRDLRRSLQQDGIDGLLADPGFDPTCLWGGGGIVTTPLSLCLYALTRQALSRSRLPEVELADYVASLLICFAFGRRAYHVAGAEDQKTEYLTDILAVEMAGHPGAHQHMGDFALWLAGLYPDRITCRRHRRGSPGLDYYDAMGRAGYNRASRDEQVRRKGLASLMETLSEHFVVVRRALNQVSDTHLFPPDDTNAVERLLRGVTDRDRAP